MWAHGQPVELAFWGNFPHDMVVCQKAVSHAGELCALRAIKARVDCGLAQVADETCDQAGVDAAIQAARTEARAVVRRVCSEREAQNLRYVGVLEAQTDVINICRQLENAGFSVAFGALMSGGVVPPQAPEDRECVVELATQSRKMLRLAIVETRRVLDRIAASSMTIAKKEATVARGMRRIAARISAASADLEAGCGERLATLYPHSAEVMLTNIAAQSHCFGGGLYVQGGIVCAPAMCGNGVQEPPESCDDGNTEDGDECSADCSH